VRVERRPVHRLVALSAGPGSVSAAVSEAGLMPDKHSTGTEFVTVGAARRWAGDPRTGSRADEVADVGHTSRVSRTADSSSVAA
jgi:hypothetical protein